MIAVPEVRIKKHDGSEVMPTKILSEQKDNMARCVTRPVTILRFPKILHQTPNDLFMSSVDYSMHAIMVN